VLWIAVAAGGAMGSLGRFGVQLAVERVTGRAVPIATAIVNVAGCVAIGLLAGAIAAHRFDWSASTRAFVFVGILGGFTTFSSFGLDTLRLVEDGRPGAAAWNVALQLVLGLAGVFAGYAVALRGA
jgi:CrcB protein